MDQWLTATNSMIPVAGMKNSVVFVDEGSGTLSTPKSYSEYVQ